MSVRVIEQAHHRNGVGGAGFVVSLVEWPDADAPTPHFVAVSFPCGEEVGGDMRRARFEEMTAVLSVDLLFAGNIAMTKGAAFRGADYVGPAVADAWQVRCKAEPYPYDPFADDDGGPE
jgi:hypothetical protein